jgi:small subunit ribosomal protein S14e
LTVQ